MQKSGRPEGKIEKRILQISEEQLTGAHRKRYPDSNSWSELKAYYEELNDPDRFGLDGNGIYYKNEYLMTFTPGRNGSAKAKTKDGKVNTEIDLIKQEVYFEEDGEKKGPFYFKSCPCGGNVIKIFGKDIHEIMEKGSGSAPVARREESPIKELNGASRNYLTYLKSGLGQGLASLRHRIQLDHFNIGESYAPIVAVIDTGLDLFLSHQGKRESIKLWENPGSTCRHICNDRFGYNFVDGNENVFDDHGHGTEVTSVFAENFGWGNNYRIMVLKAFDAQGHGGSYETACAIYYAIRHHADIIIASWGSPHFDPNVYLALKAAQERKIVTFAACGNFGEDISKRATPFYPALHGFEGVDKDLKLKNLYPIGATEQHKKQPADLWSDSNYHDLVLATDGEDINVVTCSYSNAVPDTSVPFNFNYLSSILPVVINGTVVKLDYYTKVVSGTSFATPRAAAMYLANDYALNAETKPSNAKGVKFRDLD